MPSSDLGETPGWKTNWSKAVFQKAIPYGKAAFNKYYQTLPNSLFYSHEKGGKKGIEGENGSIKSHS